MQKLLIVFLLIFLLEKISFAISTNASYGYKNKNVSITKTVKNIETYNSKKLITTDGEEIILNDIPVFKKYRKTPKKAEIFKQKEKIIYINLR